MEQIIQQNMLEAYKEDRKIAAITTNFREVIPDVRDGLKTVQRRILFSLLELNATHDKPYIKVARVVGDTMGKYHPHGDSSIKDAITLMATSWDSKVPYIQGHGSFGTIEGDDSADMRYIECRLDRYAEECIISDLFSIDTMVDWTPNFSNDRREPEFLPAIVPNILINGCLGIGVGVKSEVPRHNLCEVVDEVIKLIKNPNHKVFLIPDHCQTVDIIDTDWEQICNTGNGKYRARAIIDIETDPNTNSPMLIIKSIPDRVTLTAKGGAKGLISSILKDIKEKQSYPQICEMISETQGNDMRYIIKLKPGSDPIYMREVLYRTTALEQTYSVNLLLNDGLRQYPFSYTSCCQRFIQMQRELLFRKYSSMISKIDTEIVKYTFYLRMMTSGRIDEFIKDIRSLKDISIAGKQAFIETLIQKYNISDLEAEYITGIDVLKLADGYIPSYQQKIEEDMILRENYIQKILSDECIKEEMISQLQTIKKKFGQPRKCRVISIDDINCVPEGTFRIVITENNFIKKIGVDENINTIKKDAPKFTCVISNRDSLLLFDRKGKVFKIPVNNIAQCDKNNAGTRIAILLKNCTSDIIKIVPESIINDMTKSEFKNYVVIATELNAIKKIKLEELLNVNMSGTVYTKLVEGDNVADISILTDSMDVVVYSSHKALRVSMKDIPEYRRMAIGVLAMNTSTKIDGLASILPNTSDIVVVTRNGNINKFPQSALKVSNRNTAGSSVIKLSNHNEILSIFGVDNTMTLRITTPSGMTDINVSDIPVCSSISAGTKMFKEQIIKCTIL